MDAIYINIISTNKTIDIPKDMNKVIALEYEANSGIVNFKCDKIVNNCDLTESTYNFIKWENTGAKTSGAYRITDLMEAIDDEEKIEFSWVIGPEMTAMAGAINFQIGFIKIKESALEAFTEEINTSTNDSYEQKVQLLDNDFPQTIEENNSEIEYKWMTVPCLGQLSIGKSIYNDFVDAEIGPFFSFEDIKIDKTELEQILEEVFWS